MQIVDEMAFPIDTGNREQMLKILNSCIGTKYTARFGSLMAVNISQIWLSNRMHSCLHWCEQQLLQHRQP